MEGLTFWVLGAIAAFAVGLSKGGLSAFSVLAVPLLSLSISPLVAAGLLLPVYIFSDAFGVYAYRKHIDWWVFRVAAVGLVAGTAIGWATAHLVSESHVRVLVGIIGIVFALNFFFRFDAEGPPRRGNRAAGVFWMTIGGFTSFVSHAGAAPWQVWVQPQKLPKMIFAGTTAVAFAFMNAMKIIPYASLGLLQIESLRVTLILCVPAVAGVFVAFYIIRVVPQHVFYRVVTWMLLIVSIKLIWDGVGALV